MRHELTLSCEHMPDIRGRSCNDRYQGKQLGGGRSKLRGADTRQATATAHNRYDPNERPCSLGRRRLDRRVDAAGYAGSMTTFVLIGVRE
jgi:hypothetical protein